MNNQNRIIATVLVFFLLVGGAIAIFEPGSGGMALIAFVGFVAAVVTYKVLTKKPGQ